MTRTTRWCLALGLAVLPLRAAHAQTIWTPLDHRITARLEWWHPHVKSDAGFGSLGSTSGPLFFSVAFPLNESFAATFELPYARAGIKGDPFIGDYSDNTVGNPYMGIQFGSLKKPVSFVGEAGFRLAAASENSPISLAVGLLSDFDRFEAFVPKSNTLSAAGNVVLRGTTSLTRFRVGATQIFSDDSTGIGNHTIIDYGAQSSVDVQQFRFGGALTGRYAADGGGTFGERSNHFATGMASVAFDNFRPSLSLRLPFEKDIRDSVPWTLSLGLEYTFK